jgi:hypothetical protein
MVQGERQVYWSGPSIGGEYAHFTANAKHLQSLANFALIFRKIQLMRASRHRYTFI